MDELEMIIQNIKDVKYVTDGVPMYVITFVDDSVLELVSDRVYKYTYSRSVGYAQDVSLCALQRIDFSRLSSTIGSRRIG